MTLADFPAMYLMGSGVVWAKDSGAGAPMVFGAGIGCTAARRISAGFFPRKTRMIAIDITGPGPLRPMVEGHR